MVEQKCLKKDHETTLADFETLMLSITVDTSIRKEHQRDHDFQLVEKCEFINEKNFDRKQSN